MLTIAEFAIASTQYLDPSGEAIGPMPPFAQQPNELVALYRGMVLTRTFDAKAIALQRTGAWEPMHRRSGRRLCP